MDILKKKLCDDLVWEIYSYICGDTYDNFDNILYELEDYWFDMEQPCDNEMCPKVGWTKDMIADGAVPRMPNNRFQQTLPPYGNIHYYCSENCMSYDQWSRSYDLRKSNRRQLNFAM